MVLLLSNYSPMAYTSRTFWCFIIAVLLFIIIYNRIETFLDAQYAKEEEAKEGSPAVLIAQLYFEWKHKRLLLDSGPHIRGIVESDIRNNSDTFSETSH